MMLLDELQDVPADRIACVAHRGSVAYTGGTGIVNRPLLSQDSAGKYGARPFLLPIAEGDHVVKSFAEERINQLGPCGRDVDADLLHSDD
jgi:hypothetical protein